MTMQWDIVERLRNSSPNECSHELQCRCLDAAAEIERLRTAMGEAAARLGARIITQPVACACGNHGCNGQRYRPPYARESVPCPLLASAQSAENTAASTAYCLANSDCVGAPSVLNKA